MTKFQQLQAENAELIYQRDERDREIERLKECAVNMVHRERRNRISRRRDMFLSTVVLVMLGLTGVAVMYGFMDFVQWLST
jgi:hypothetical protein